MAGTQVRIEGGQGFLAGVDRTVNALQTITVAHHAIHEGEAFVMSTKATKGSSETYEVRLLTPASPAEIHMFIKLSATGAATFDIFEGTAKTHVGGNALTPYNRNRNSSRTHGLDAICHTPGGTGDGTLIWTGAGGSAGGFFGLGASGGATRGDSEFILKYATAYLIRTTSGAAGNTLLYELDWYEETTVTHPVYG